MARTLREIAKLEQPRLVDIRIVVGLALLVGRVARPRCKVSDGAGRPIAIEGFQAEAKLQEFRLHTRKRRDGVARQNADRRFVASDRAPYEILAARIADLDD
jgi:hypothetical protein